MRILITEDDNAIQLLLSRQIARWGYETATAGNGEEAVKIMQSPERPDIIIMDWMMPVMSGLEACKIIKGMTSLPMTYILMLTSKHERSDMVAGLNAGADDFLCKPVDSTELHSRIKVAERTIHYERQLRSYAQDMERLARERAEQLVHADRLATIGTLSSGIAHEISNPLGAIMGNAQLLQMYWKSLEPFLPAIRRENPPAEVLSIIDEIPEMLESIDTGSQRITELINAIKRFYRKNEAAQRELYTLNDCVKNSLRVCWPKLKYTIDLQQQLQEPSPVVRANPQQLDQVMINLLVNACEAITVQGNGKGMIRITTSTNEGRCSIEVFNDGPAIPQMQLEKIWQAFYTTKPEGSGLGLSISSSIMREHNGALQVENCSGGGVAFRLTLPECSASENPHES